MPTGQERLNEYSGYEPAPGSGGNNTIDRVSPSIGPEEFFQKYVANRRPAILTGHPTDPSWSGQLWTNEYLKEKAGEADVIVEQRAEEGFGLMAPKIGMKYGEFLSKIMAGDERMYLTTQDLERFEEDVDDMGMPQSIMAEPLKSIARDFPERPNILGNLIPYQLTLWQGLTEDGTTSGLHHDYHDNMYVLVRGRKRFRLFPPSMGPQMRTSGQLVKIHPNGLLVYKIGQQNLEVPVRADGVSKEYLAKVKKDEAEAEMEEGEMELEEVMTSDLSDDERTVKVKKLKERILDCEERMELALEEMLRYVAAEDADSEADSDEDLGEPYQKKPKLSGQNGCHGTTLPSHQTEASQTDNCHHAKPTHCADYTVVPSNKTSLKTGEIPVNNLHRPDHFCNISFPTDSDDPDVVFEKCPDLKDAGHIICEVKAGEMLYLPASWFHEVTSFSCKSSENPDATTDKGHLAFNYWMFPPDGSCFDQPYEDDFWQRRWEDVQRNKKSSQTGMTS